MIHKYWHELFDLSLIIKGGIGIIETVSGFFVLFISRSAIDRIFAFFSSTELLEDPTDPVFSYLSASLTHLTSGAKIFAGIYVLIHGLLNLFIVIGLKRDKLWVYWVAMVSIILFMTYQIYRFAHTQAPGLIVLTILDLIFLIIIRHEHIYHTGRLKKNQL